MITIKSNWQQILKPMHKMPAFIREAVALVVLAFYFLVLELQTQVSRFQRLSLLQHLKKSRRKRLILLQIALRKTRRPRRELSWPRNQFWFETLLHGNVVDDWWKENFRISRRTFCDLQRFTGYTFAGAHVDTHKVQFNSTW